ncbi:metalloprotease TldD [Alcaligenes endophyticus]|uniref:Metalloprotease TldD n=1 Tax=Alcaligenes endophyticus TaxID=1929088 RepID=A0ABT8EHZ7_9BURK|nr:metalloprotease TldD [Alcaligenes endophyticus]MCX5592713.1 metalloprotease TldD [Alcaligenes endophyticus]MDN4120901.1 metalloprotease TldD [Alcaligenes endophyticus]
MNVLDPTIDALATARGLLLEPWGLDESHLGMALDEIFVHKADYADLYFQYTRSEGWSLDEGMVKTGSFSIEQGVGVRALSGEKTAFAYSDSLQLDALLSSARVVRSIASQGGQAKQKILTPWQSNKPSLYTGLDPIASLDANEKVALLTRLDTMARAADSRVIQVMASLGAEYDVVLIAGSDGRLVADVRPLVQLSLSLIMEKDGRRERGYASGGGRVNLSYFDDELLRSYVDKAIHAASVNLEARPAPAGEMTVVLGSGWPGIMLHEAVGHGLEGDFNRRGSSIFSGRIGERVASPGVTVIDDGTLAQRRGSLNVDDEGTPTQSTVLIEDGILRAYLQDKHNARLMKTRSTGNGRRESYACLPMPRMTNTFMLGGDTDPQEIIASVKKGLYAVDFGGGQVDITSGKFVFSASEAWMIENGKLMYPVKGATLIGNGPEAMNQVTMIGNDMRLDSGVGTCGKEGQSVPVGVGMPTVRMEGLTVGGTA